MNHLIALTSNTIGNATIQTVNARDLHAFLGSKQDFSHWIKKRIKDYEFTENKDYLVDKIIDNLQGGRPILEYYISIDMAKELSMVERNAKGKEARLYFIACERLAADPEAIATAYLSNINAVIFAGKEAEKKLAIIQGLAGTAERTKQEIRKNPIEPRVRYIVKEGTLRPKPAVYMHPQIPFFCGDIPCEWMTLPELASVSHIKEWELWQALWAKGFLTWDGLPTKPQPFAKFNDLPYLFKADETLKALDAQRQSGIINN